MSTFREKESERIVDNIKILFKEIAIRRNKKEYKEYKMLITSVINLIDTHRKINNYSIDVDLYENIIINIKNEINEVLIIINKLINNKSFDSYKYLNDIYTRMVEKCQNLINDLEQQKNNKNIYVTWEQNINIMCYVDIFREINKILINIIMFDLKSNKILQNKILDSSKRKKLINYDSWNINDELLSFILCKKPNSIIFNTLGIGQSYYDSFIKYIKDKKSINIDKNGYINY